MPTPTIDEVEEFYRDRVLGWMIRDLRASVEANTNYLTALGCLVYTEVIGTLLPDIKGEKGELKSKRFYRCFFRLYSKDLLKSLDNYIRKETQRSLYVQLRHSAAHKYYPTIAMRIDNQWNFIPMIVSKHGVITNQGKKFYPPMFLTSEGSFAIATTNYVDELEKCVIDSMDKTFVKKDQEYIKAAIRGAKTLFQGEP